MFYVYSMQVHNSIVICKLYNNEYKKEKRRLRFYSTHTVQH